MQEAAGGEVKEDAMPKCEQCEMRVMGMKKVQRTVDNKLQEKAMLLCPKRNAATGRNSGFQIEQEG